MPPVGFEPTISADERPKTYALDRAATGTGINKLLGVANKYGGRGNSDIRISWVKSETVCIQGRLRRAF